MCQWLEGKKAHAIPAAEAHVVADIAEKNDYDYQEITATPVSGHSPPVPTGRPEPEVPPHGGGSPATAPASGAPTTVKGIVQNVEIGTTTNKHVPKADVRIGGSHYRTYIKPLFEYFANAKGKEAEVLLDERKQIVGVVRIGTRMFDADGRTPILQMGEDRGTTAQLFT
jgi:hypothetical protein